MSKLIQINTETYEHNIDEIQHEFNNLKNKEWKNEEGIYYEVKIKDNRFDKRSDIFIQLATYLKKNLLILWDNVITAVLIYDHTSIYPIKVSLPKQYLELVDNSINIHYWELYDKISERVPQIFFKGHRLFLDDRVHNRLSLVFRILDLHVNAFSLTYHDTTFENEMSLTPKQQLVYAIDHAKENIDKNGVPVFPFRLVDGAHLKNANRMWNEVILKDNFYNNWTNNFQIINAKQFQKLGFGNSNGYLSMCGGTHHFKNTVGEGSNNHDNTSVRQALTIHGLSYYGKAILVQTILLYPSDANETNMVMGQLKTYIVVTEDFQLYFYIMLEHADTPSSWLDSGFLIYIGTRFNYVDNYDNLNVYQGSGCILDFITMFNDSELFKMQTVNLHAIISNIFVGKLVEVKHYKYFLKPFTFLSMITPFTIIREALPSLSTKHSTRRGSSRIKCMSFLTSGELRRYTPYFYRLPCGLLPKYNYVGLNFHECSIALFHTMSIFTGTSYNCTKCNRYYCFAVVANHCESLCSLKMG